jgi:lactobin A/cerein 7B family class IIb bacteriocin
MPEFIELTDEELAIVAGGVSLTGGASTAFTGGIGTGTFSSANSTASSTSATNGGSVGAATLASFTLAASPPGS